MHQHDKGDKRSTTCCLNRALTRRSPVLSKRFALTEYEMALPSKHIRLSFLWRKATATLTLKFEDRKAISSKVLDTKWGNEFNVATYKSRQFQTLKDGLLITLSMTSPQLVNWFWKIRMESLERPCPILKKANLSAKQLSQIICSVCHHTLMSHRLCSSNPHVTVIKQRRLWELQKFCQIKLCRWS